MKEKAWAKINLHLDVLKKRPDDFHDLEMVMTPLALHDVLKFEVLNTDTIEVTESKPVCEDPTDNLAYKAALLFKETHGIEQGVRIHIEKHIPIAAGLGGGSADAAATLRGMNRLFNVKASASQLAKLGEKLGSDVPFCVHSRLCIARGKGEQLFFLKNRLKYRVAVITPDIHISTKSIFELVEMKAIKSVKITTMTNAIYNGNYELLAHSLYNALEPFAFKKYPEVKELKDAISGFDVDGVLMSGSGPSIFVLDHDKKTLQSIVEHFSDTHHTYLTKMT